MQTFSTMASGRFFVIDNSNRDIGLSSKASADIGKSLVEAAEA